MRKKIIFCLIVSFMLSGSAVLTAEILAQGTTKAVNIQYPIEELGNCQNKTACKTYCDKPENMEPCLNFAEKNNLMPKEEIATAKKFAATKAKKPGNCTTKDSCEAYCDDISHIDECLTFAQENNLIPPKELEEAKKVQAAIKRGVKPPACGNKKACDVYCESPEHMEECVSFALEAGFMSEQEKADSQKMLAAIKRGVKPPACKGKKECDEYCGQPENMEICMTFALEAGFMSEQEKADSQKMLAAIKKGVKPPNCRGKEECDEYCQQDEHFAECLNFAEAAGFMNPEEAAISRKTGGKGPSNCKGKEECDAFCNNPDNQETCFNFAKEYGLIPEEDLKRMEQGKQQLKQGIEQAPQEVLDCLVSQLGSDKVEKIKSGDFMPSQEIGDKMRQCFEKMGPRPEQRGPGGESIMQPGQAGPGGCATPEECQAYCETHLEECQNFQPTAPQGFPEPRIQQGGLAPGQMPTGPGGCKTPEECQSFCAANPQECQNFQRPITEPTPETGGQGERTVPYGGPGGFIKIQPVCETPEQCQQMQQQIQQQIQNQMAPPQPCEGEGCNFGPSPEGQPISQQPQQPQPSAPMEQNFPAQPLPTQPAPQPAEAQPPIPQAPPSSQPQPTNSSSPTSELISPKLLLGSILTLFNQLFSPEK